MTIDERLEKLAERHEALTQSVELMTAENRDRDQRWAEEDQRWKERHEALTQSVKLMAAENRDRDQRWAEEDQRWKERHEALTQSVELLAVEHAKTENTLRRAIRLGVREARHERKRRQEVDKRQQELAKRQQDLSDYADKRHQELEALLKAFLERGGNGKH